MNNSEIPYLKLLNQQPKDMSKEGHFELTVSFGNADSEVFTYSKKADLATAILLVVWVNCCVAEDGLFHLLDFYKWASHKKFECGPRSDYELPQEDHFLYAEGRNGYPLLPRVENVKWVRPDGDIVY